MHAIYFESEMIDSFFKKECCPIVDNRKKSSIEFLVKDGIIKRLQGIQLKFIHQDLSTLFSEYDIPNKNKLTKEFIEEIDVINLKVRVNRAKSIGPDVLIHLKGLMQSYIDAENTDQEHKSKEIEQIE